MKYVALHCFHENFSMFTNTLEITKNSHITSAHWLTKQNPLKTHRTPELDTATAQCVQRVAVW